MPAPEPVTLSTGSARLHLHPLSTDDAEAATAFDQQLFGRLAFSKELFADAADSPYNHYVVLRAGDYQPLDASTAAATGTDIIALAGVSLFAPIADIQTLGVHPHWRGRGIARAILRYLHRYAVAQWQVEAMMLEVAERNTAAQQLYLEEGYEPIHRRKDYYGQGEHGIVMRCENPAGKVQ